MVIEPYWHQDTWVFDDASVGLDKEPFVQGIPDMIDYLVKDIPNARSGFILLFSSQPFAGYQAELTRVREENGGCWYNVKDLGAEGWLCPALLRYFDAPPESIYVKAESSHRQVSIEQSELEALKERVDNLEQSVGQLILKYDLLKRGKET
jgi:hypothetical protein